MNIEDLLLKVHLQDHILEDGQSHSGHLQVEESEDSLSA